MEAESAVPCLVRFRKQNTAWKNNYIDFPFENFITKIIVFIYKINYFLVASTRNTNIATEMH